MVRAKFICQRVEDIKYAGSTTKNIVLTPVQPYNDPEAKEFWESTPSGEIVLRTVNKAAAEQFTPGVKYYIDFTPIEELPA